MQTRREGVKKPENFVDVIHGRSLSVIVALHILAKPQCDSRTKCTPGGGVSEEPEGHKNLTCKRTEKLMCPDNDLLPCVHYSSAVWLIFIY